MSIGNRLEDEEILDISLRELYSALGDHDTPILFDQPYTVNTDYDISFGAGNSLDRKTKYIDRTLYRELMAGAFNASGLTPEQILGRWLDHEHCEVCIVDGDNPVDTYTPAHKRALRMEHVGVLAILGTQDAENKIKRYEATIWPGLESAYKRPVKSAPPDLWCGPLLEDIDERGEEILKELAGMGVADARKRSKFDTHYGFGSRPCEECRHWMPQVMVDEAGQLASCRVNCGLVRADRHCDFFMQAKERLFHPSQIGARQAPDGEFYIPDTRRPGKYLQVRTRAKGESTMSNQLPIKVAPVANTQQKGGRVTTGGEAPSFGAVRKPQ